jgi:hypothetical protein
LICIGGEIEMAKDDHWIQGAMKHPGALHRELDVPQGDKIPAKKIMKAEHSDNPALARRAHLAETLKHLHKKHGGCV